jgi:hypothetical protein
MLAIVLLVLVVLVLPVALRFFAEGDNPGNGSVHHCDDEDDPPDTAPDDVLLAA